MNKIYYDKFLAEGNAIPRLSTALRRLGATPRIYLFLVIQRARHLLLLFGSAAPYFSLFSLSFLSLHYSPFLSLHYHLIFPQLFHFIIIACHHLLSSHGLRLYFHRLSSRLLFPWLETLKGIIYFYNTLFSSF